MDFWVPVVLGAFKLIVLGTCLFFAVKSHYDGARLEKEKAAKAKAEEMKGP